MSAFLAWGGLLAAGLSLENVLLIAAAVFCVGVYGVLSRQNVLVLLMSVELILNGANLALVAFGRAALRPISEGPASQGAAAAMGSSANSAHVFVVMVLAVAAAEAGVGLAILLAAYRRWRTVQTGEIRSMWG